MDIFITAAGIIGIWLVVVLLGFHIINGLRKGRVGKEGVLVRILWLIFFALAGAFYLFVSPARPSFGNTLFLVVAVLVGLVMGIFAVLAFRNSANNNNTDNKH